MAFNLATLKGLFGKLKPAANAIANYGDDVANAVVNYGDDVAGVVANYGDDAAKALTTYGDDVVRAADDIDNVDDYVDLFSLPGLDEIGRNDPPVEFDADTTAELLRDAELRREADYWKSVANDAEDDLIYLDRDSLWNTSYGQDPYTPEMQQKSHNLITKMRLANERADRFMPTATRTTQDILGLPGNVDVPKIPTKELVRMHSFGGYRPHKNTALGRWFQQNAPQFNLWDVVDDSHYLSRYK